jgi:LytTr DNA-binding domain
MSEPSTPLRRYLEHRRVYEFLLWSALFLLEATANSVTAAMALRREHVPFTAWEPPVWEFSSCLTLLALVPMVLAVEHRYPFRFGLWRRSLAMHALATVPFSLLHVTVMVLMRKLVYGLAGRQYDFGNAPRELANEYLKDARTYAFILCCLYVYRFFLLQLQGEARLLSAAEDAPAPSIAEQRPERFLVRKLGKEFLVAAADIEWLEASGNYVNLHVRGRRYPLRSTMAALEPQLDARRFRRVHRSFIVNLDQVAEIEPLESGDARVKMRDGTAVPCSRRYRDAFRRNVV